MAEESSGPAIGIDLGTTFSLVAVCEKGEPRVLRNALGEPLTPSAVGIDANGEILVGRAALDRCATSPHPVATVFKRDMGMDRRVSLGDGRDLSPVDLSACVLLSLKKDAENALGVPVEDAVISVPAYFNDDQRRATRHAAELAGLRVDRLINEPTAAAVAYGLHHLDRECTAVVLDLGGGTFDVTVLEIIEGVVEISATSGDIRLGGEDLTQILREHVSSLILKKYGGKVAGASATERRLQKACEEAKKMLSRDPSTQLDLPQLELESGRRVDVSIPLLRSEVEALWTPVLDRVRAPILRALRDAGLTADRIDEVLLVGGATRTPVFKALASELFPHSNQQDRLAKDTIVAMGAAVQAALKAGHQALDDLIVTDVASFSLGVEIVHFHKAVPVEGVFSPILERGTVIPASRVKRYFTLHPEQTEVHLRIYQGEHPRCSRNLLIGELQIDEIPPVSGVEDGFEVRFSYDLDGILEVEATVIGTGKVHSMVIEQTPGRLGPDELTAARQAFEALKFHPRDALPNTAALAKAEALYAELRGEPRNHVGLVVAQFRAALEAQDIEQIDQVRAYLLELTETFMSRGAYRGDPP